jgi:site-specific recombinase XerC
MTLLPDTAWPARWLKTLGEPRGHRFAQRDELLARLTIRHGLRANELCALRFTNVDVSKGRLRCGGVGRTKARVRSLDAVDLSLIKALKSAAASLPGDTGIIFRTKSGAAMGRIDVWRVLRRIGAEAGLETPLHTRRARHTLAHLTAASSDSDAVAVADTLGLQSLDAVASYLPRCRRRDV